MGYLGELYSREDFLRIRKWRDFYFRLPQFLRWWGPMARWNQRLYQAEIAIENEIWSRRYATYQKERRRMQMLFIGPTGIPRSRKAA